MEPLSAEDIKKLVSDIIEEILDQITSEYFENESETSEQDLQCECELQFLSDGQRSEDKNSNVYNFNEISHESSEYLDHDNLPTEFHKGTFHLEKVYGFNLNVPVIHQGNGKIIRAAAHLIVVYDTSNDTEKVLTGHKNEISSITHGGSYIATADFGGRQSMITLWEKKTLKPIRCWISPFKGGTQLIRLTLDGDYLWTVSAGQQNTLKIWSVKDKLMQITQLPDFEATPKHLCISHVNSNQCVITYPHDICIITSEDSDLIVKASNHPRNKQKLGVYRTSNFLNKENNLITGTSRGQIIIWTNQGVYIKAVQLHLSAIVSTCILENKLLVVFEEGQLGLYMQDLVLQHWVTQNASPIESISFDPESSSSFSDYVVATKRGHMYMVKHGSFKRNILHRSEVPITAMDARPKTIYFVTGDANGEVSLYNIEAHVVEISRKIVESPITALKYSENGAILAAGSERGDFFILDPMILCVDKVLPMAKSGIRKILFSNNNTLCFYYHAMSLVLIKRLIEWTMRGEHCAHREPITDMTRNKERLYTIAEDRFLAEYDIKRSLIFLGRFRLEQTARPLSSVWYENVLLVANSDHKIRFVDVSSREIIRTIQGPFTSPIHKMLLKENMIIYASGKYLGVCELPSSQWRPQTQAFPNKIGSIDTIGDRIIVTSHNHSCILAWTMDHSSIPPEVESLPPYIESEINTIFESGPILVQDLINKMCFLGYFPTNFEEANILREMDSPDVTEDEFRSLLFNHKPIQGPTIAQLRYSLQCVTDFKDGQYVIDTHKLIKAFETCMEPMATSKVIKCLKILLKPMKIPPNFTAEQFLNDVLGVET